MPLEKIVANELIPELARFLPYTAEQLESCTRDEVYTLIDGAHTPAPSVLDERRRHTVAGLYKGEFVLWVGKEIEEKLIPLLPRVDYGARELSGQVAMKGKAIGPCYVINWETEMTASQVDTMPDGMVLVAGQTRPQLMGAIKKSCAIVTDEGGVLSHAAIVSRELRIPCVIGTGYATKILKTGDMVEVDADNGIIRKI
jgi:phosphoenolpyruvate synthase/pyruvate phosphate dikinase